MYPSFYKPQIKFRGNPKVLLSNIQFILLDYKKQPGTRPGGDEIIRKPWIAHRNFLIANRLLLTV